MPRRPQCDHPARRSGRCVLCHRAYQRRYYRAHTPRPRKSSRKRAAQVRRYISSAADWYLRLLLSQGTQIPPRSWPGDLVALKRATLLAKRATRPTRPTCPTRPTP